LLVDQCLVGLFVPKFDLGLKSQQGSIGLGDLVGQLPDPGRGGINVSLAGLEVVVAGVGRGWRHRFPDGRLSYQRQNREQHWDQRTAGKATPSPDAHTALPPQ
jgi:hypothetical protein